MWLPIEARRVVDPLELESWVIVSPLTRVLGTKLRVSAGAVNALRLGS